MAVRRGVPWDTALEHETAALPEIDRRLAHELAAGTLRHADALDALLARFVRRGLGSVSTRLLDVLRLGTYQLRLLDRIPPHAAVTTSVALAREQVGDRVSGFTNAVLRRIAELPPQVVQPPIVDDVARLAATWSHPTWLVARWLARFGDVATAHLLQWNNARPPLVLQPVRGGIGDLQRLLSEHGIASAAAAFGAGVRVRRGQPKRLPGFATGEFFVQDPAQALVMQFAAFPADAVVYDACAAPGGKAMQLAARATAVIAADRSLRRVERLRDNVRRTARGVEHLLVADAAHPPVRPVRAYLLDAPCLGTGTFARHPEARLRVSETALFALAGRQATLLDAAADRIAPGGVLCYATCSIEPEENVMQIEAFLRRHPDFRREPSGDCVPELLTEAGDFATLPQRDGVDGAFAARLVRAG